MACEEWDTARAEWVAKWHDPLCGCGWDGKDILNLLVNEQLGEKT
jgi:hypothetical protein